eukprot:TRINITY_DN3741_c0_g3_i3.p1 TRINITY_DN3741_c0_g3~~TRINITY_DN3741_c0_g3_i3.p1  ORF type:complete len:180 (-),score=23.02 TRINITY_DN3741_c0_g3_i3:1074-1613(-)
MGVPHKWTITLSDSQPDRSRVKSPPGYDADPKDTEPFQSSSKKGGNTTVAQNSAILNKKQQALYKQAQAPMGQVGMMCFMMWMWGNQIQIFTIIIVFSSIYSAFSQILNSAAMFPSSDSAPGLDVIGPRLLYSLIYGGQVIFGLYKLNGMGLLPTAPADLISSVPPVPQQQFAVGGVVG